jgi:hypothetical protein
LFGALLFSVYLLILSISELIKTFDSNFAISIIKIFSIILVILVLERWIIHNEMNIKRLGDKLDKLNENKE